MAKITYIEEDLGIEYSVKLDSYANIDDTIQFGIEPLLRAIGYSKDVIEEALYIAARLKGYEDEE